MVPEDLHIKDAARNKGSPSHLALFYTISLLLLCFYGSSFNLATPFLQFAKASHQTPNIVYSRHDMILQCGFSHSYFNCMVNKRRNNYICRDTLDIF